MSKHIKITFSLILVICLVLSGLPSGSLVVANASEAPTMDSIASDTGTQLAEPELSIITDVEQGSNAIIIQEDVSRRAEYEKHFLMSDGSYQVALYNEPVHQMENGEWVEVDNTLALQMAADGTAQYVTANGLSDIRFAQSFDEQLVTMQQDGHAVSWGIQAFSNNLSMDTSAELVQPVRGELVPSELSTLSVEQQKTLATKASSAIQYRNALRQNVDLEYIVLPTRVKENIILQSAQDISYYVVTVYTENLSARLLENREIEFYNDSDEVIFTMTSPYMYDNAGELSEDITVEMVSKGDGCYFIKMTPNAQWLSSESRVYPVVIDPQVSVDTTRSNIIDNYVLKDAGVQNRNLDRLYIGNRPEGLTRAFIQYATTPTLPENSIITAATMTLTFTNGTDTAETAAASMVTEGEWASGTIEWANMPEANIELESNISHNNLTGYTFSCLSAVQAWYNGDTTGQNANYGITLRYQNETATDYNAVYSADYTDESKRPALAITYQSPIVDVDEGETLTLSAPDTTDTITWASSDTTVATVNASGVVTGIKAGVTTVTASVGGMVRKIYTVYVTILDGVYHISQGSLYLGTSGSIRDYTEAHLLASQTSGVSSLAQLWKITHYSKGYYSVRPMHKLDMALGATSGNVTISEVGSVDGPSTVWSNNGWSIAYSTSGYVFRNYGASGEAMHCTAVYPGADILTDTYSATSSVFHWTLSRISNPPSGVLLYDTSIGGVVTLPTKYMYVSESKSLAEFNLIPAVYAEGVNSAVFRWRNNNASFTVNSYTGEVTAISNSEEPALITGTSNYGTVQFEVYVLPIQDGTYFINNRLYNRLLQIDNSDSSIGYNTSGSTVGLQTFDGGDYQKWEITTLTDGYYSIISVESGLALSVASGEIEGNDISLVQEAYNNLNRQKWKITQTDRGYYMIKPKVAEDWDNYTDEWELWLVGLEAFLLGVNAPESGHDHYSIQGTIMPDLQELGYNSFNCIVTDFISLADTQEYLQQCKVFISRGHGGSDGNGTFICLAKSEESYLGTSNIYDFTAHTPIINLTNCDLAIFVGCSTSAVEGTSLPDAAIAAGAKYAIGFNEVIYCGAANNWTECFFQYCTEGYSVPLSALTAAGECSLSCRVVARSN